MRETKRNSPINVVARPKRVSSKWSTRAKRRLRKLLNYVRSNFNTVKLGRAQRRLRLCESLSLGEKRVIAVVQFERQRFLIGASGSSINLLSTLPAENNFATTLSSFAKPDQKVSL